MKVLFITLVATKDINNRGLYNDLLRTFAEHGHDIYVVAPTERRHKQATHLIKTENAKIVNVKTLNIQKTNFVEKGIGSLLLEYQYLRAIKKYFPDVTFDLIIYSTPPITFSKVISYIKQKDKAFAYLLLKDIFPQNAVDMGFFKKNSFIYNFFRKKEINLYNISDKIGCMSPANVQYVLDHNPNVPLSKIEVCPNSITPLPIIPSNDAQKADIKAKYGVPDDKIVFVYGGNLGKPQGINFLITVLNSNKTNPHYYFLIIGDGTEYTKLAAWFEENKPENAQLRQVLPKEDYDKLLKACDVGMLFLDARFTIPNFPSRILSYMENGMPTIAATDVNTDIGELMVRGKFGLWARAGDLDTFNTHLERFREQNLVKRMGKNARSYLEINFTPEINYKIIMENFKENIFLIP